MKKSQPQLYFRPTILEMDPYIPGEQPSTANVIKLNTNENPYLPAPLVFKALQQYSKERMRLYPPSQPIKLIQRLSRIYHWPMDGILVGNGSDEILSMIFQAVLEKGRSVQFPNLTYSLYPVLASLNNAEIKKVYLDNNFELLFNQCSLKSHLTIWGNPNPPIGNCFSTEDMKKFCRQTQGLVVIDEAYVDFSNASVIAWARQFPNVLILRTLSKSFSLASIRLGFVLGNASVIHQLLKVKNSYNVSDLTQTLGMAALQPSSLTYVKKTIQNICSERVRLTEQLRNQGFDVPASQANFVLAFHPQAQLVYNELKKNNIFVRYFPYDRLKNAIRITIGSPNQNHQLLKACQEILKISKK
jgi:histidinol-phosphate aminotransferase